MDGLECCEVQFSEICTAKYKRFDSQYFLKIYLSNERKLEKFSFKIVDDIFSQVTDFGAYSQTNFIDLRKCGTNFFRSQDVGECTLEKNCAKIDCQIYERLTLKLQENDIIVPRTGKLGNACTVLPSHLPASANQNTAILRGGIGFYPEYVSLLLCSRICKLQIERDSTGNVQQWLNLDMLKQLMIPKASDAFQKVIKNTVKKREALLENAYFLYSSAESILLSTLKYKPITQLGNHTQKSFSASFGATGRLDAEYYQPKYDEVCASLHTSDTVHSLCVLHDQNFVPNGKQKYTYIELADVGQMGEISGADPVCGAELPTRARRKVEAGQVIISSIEGSLQSCALITDEFNGALCSTGFYILTSESLNPETLLVLFKSEPIQALMKQRCSGTILTAISKDELLSMPLPKINETVQKEITAKVQESFSLRRQSKQLLENAKHAVEMAIEQGEDKAMRWLQEQSKYS